jgi:hypothetical protein
MLAHRILFLATLAAAVPPLAACGSSAIEETGPGPLPTPSPTPSPLPANAVVGHLGTVEHLTARDGFLYWAEITSMTDQPWSIRRVAESGGTPTTLVAATEEPKGLAVDATRVYWTGGYEGNRLLAVSRDGEDPSVAPTVIAFPLTGPSSVVVEGSDAYVVDTSAVMRVSLADGTTSVAVLGDTGYFSVAPVAQGGGVVAVTHAAACSGGATPCFTTMIERSPVAVPGGTAAPSQLYGSNDAVDGLALDGDSVYLAEKTGGDHGWDHIVKIPLTGTDGPTEVLAAGTNTVESLVATAGTLYWYTGVGSVVSMPAAGGTPRMIASDAVKALVADGGHVFGLTTLADGTSAIVHES